MWNELYDKAVAMLWLIFIVAWLWIITYYKLGGKQ
jgi:hypothetical protein